MTKTLHLLIGPKGAGKTYIGDLVERELGIRFLRVEPIWLSLKPGQDGWKEIERELGEIFATTDEVILESLGVGEGFERMKNVLETKYRLRFVKVFAESDECLRRVRSREAVDQIAVSDAQAADYNRLAAEARHPWSGEIDNRGFASREQIVAAFQQSRRQGKQPTRTLPRER